MLALRAILIFATLAVTAAAGIPQDKAKHLVAGALVGGTVTWIAKENGSKHPELWGVVATLAVGALKEASDRRHPGNHWDGKDLGATMAGGIVVSYSVRW